MAAGNTGTAKVKKARSAPKPMTLFAVVNGGKDAIRGIFRDAGDAFDCAEQNEGTRPVKVTLPPRSKAGAVETA